MCEWKWCLSFFISWSLLGWSLSLSINCWGSSWSLFIFSIWISRDLWSLNHAKESVICHFKARILSHQPKLICGHFVLIKSSLEGIQLCHFLESNQVVESAISFNVNSHSDTEVTACVYLGNWNSSILAVLAFLEP